ncbi:MAG: inositol monophosphatase family protein [Solirubrobacteraceae bacterium]
MTQDEERQLLAVAHEAAHAAAAELKQRYGRRQSGVRSKSGPTDLVSDADLAAEKAIRTVIAERRPDDAILGEEGGATGEGDLRWVVDPLDGTINYLYEIPAFAVSVACEDASGTIAGVVLDPLRDELFAATRSGPPTLNGLAFEVDDRPDTLGMTMVATGFGYDPVVRARQAAVVARVLPSVRDIRRGGAAALDLAWNACGRVDAFYERGLNVWDIAAGALVCSRAGLAVREFPASGDERWGIMSAPPGLVDELYELIDA